MKFERKEYPRPQFRRDRWLGLNGEWEFCFDDQNDGIVRGLPTGNIALDKKIHVPFSYQYPASGIGDETQHDVVWYRRTFTAEKGKCAMLNFNGVDYKADIWINGYHAADHEGGFAPFSVDITRYLQTGENVIVVRCEDKLDDARPCGKQSFTGKKCGCWYIPNSGIWQSVWIDYFDGDCIEKYALFANYDDKAFYGDMQTLHGRATAVEIVATLRGKELNRQKMRIRGAHTKYYVPLTPNFFENYDWTPNNPQLIDVDFILYIGDQVADIAHTRFGLKKICVDEHGTICLNHLPFYQRLVLDQGYWEESGLTPPSAEALKQDIALAKAMGFNGARKHQKFEDPYYYYFAEEMGFVTWCEMPSAYRYCEKEIQALTKEWLEILSVAKNFTSIVCYVPLNESWGVWEIGTDTTQQKFAAALYYLTKSMDATKLVSSNDGYENINDTDIVSIHEYDIRRAEEFPKRYNKDLNGEYQQIRPIFAKGHAYRDQPILFTEFGGIAMKKEVKDGAWGYGNAAKNDEEFLNRLQELFNGIATTNFQGYCYTQLTDVQQEINGLLYPDRTPKIAVEKIKEILN